ncbi:MAG: DNA helicase RecQ [Clostridiales bacterium]|nr:DNA helicase RecQ [Clostridiales bacterium]
MDKYEVLKKYFGYDSFREGQEMLIDAVLKGQDALGIMPTGAGKSICYQVPALLLPGVTLVVSPLISLMKDQVQSLNQAGIHAAYINSSLTEGQIAKALGLAAQGAYKIIYVAPERLESYGFLQFAAKAQITMLTVDEAHCISQWGQDFRPSYLKIVQFIRRLPRRPVISAFTATATETVQDDIVCVLGLRNPTVLVTGFDRKNLYFAVETPRKKDAYLLHYVQEHAGDSGVIYCATRKSVEAVCEKLAAVRIPVTRYHAGLSGEERKQNQEDFIYDRKPVMVATNAFGMGIDKSNVRYVIHYNMPQSLENYYQEAGRAGRDGEPGECILLYSPQDMVTNRFLLGSKEQNAEMTEEQLAAIRERDEERLQAMYHYCMTRNCLREYILHYFGEQGSGRCENCSNCRKEFEEVNVTEEGRQIIRCILEMRQRYGVNVVAGTLLGDNRARLKEYHVSDYPSYGSLKGHTEAEIKEIINQMIVEGVLAQTRDRYALLRIAPKAQGILKGEEELFLKRPLHADPPPAPNGQMAGDFDIVSPKRKKSDILNSRGLELFETLRKLRMEIAREEAVPPYMIFSDKTLVDMCVKLPGDKKEMLNVSGVGENKYQKYGERFLRQMKEYTGGIRRDTTNGR